LLLLPSEFNYTHPVTSSKLMLSKSQSLYSEESSLELLSLMVMSSERSVCNVVGAGASSFSAVAAAAVAAAGTSDAIAMVLSSVGASSCLLMMAAAVVVDVAVAAAATGTSIRDRRLASVSERQDIASRHMIAVVLNLGSIVYVCVCVCL